MRRNRTDRGGPAAALSTGTRSTGTPASSGWARSRRIGRCFGLKTMASVQLSNVDKKSEEGQVRVNLCNYVDVYYHDRITTELEWHEFNRHTRAGAAIPAWCDDVLITKDSESWNDIAVPAVVAEGLKDVLCGYHLAHIKPRPDLHGRFLARCSRRSQASCGTSSTLRRME